MQRDPGGLEQRFDLLVVGAGICGAALARLAARSGLRVALIDRGDFGAATSRNSAKLVHGGLRYVQHLDVARVRDSVLAQRSWLAAAPHIVRPLRFVIPTYGHGTRGREALAAGMLAFQALAWDRNRGLPVAGRLARSGTLGRAEFLGRFPQLGRPGVSGGAYWYDAQMCDATRLTLECVLDAAAAGAVVVNHVQARELLLGRRGVCGVAASDVLSGRALEVRARCTVNATGPWLERTLESLPRRLRGRQPAAWTRNLNLVTRRLFPGEDALGVASRQPSDAALGRSQRLFFVSPWQNCSIVGTAHAAHRGGPDEGAPEPREVERFVAEIAEALPAAGLTLDDVRYVHFGLTPAEDGDAARAHRSLLIDHARLDGIEGLLSVAAVKYTTAPIVAQSLLRTLLRRLGASGRPASFDTPFGELVAAGDTNASQEGGDGERAHAIGIYGTRAAQMLRTLPEGDGPEQVFRSRVAYGVRHEMVVTLADALLRATDRAERGVLTEAQLQWCAEHLAAAHRWSEDRRRAEIGELRRRLASRRPPRPPVRFPNPAAMQADTGMAT